VVNSLFTVGTAVADLTIACTQTSPADPNGVVRNFVDGDTIALRCTARNLGTGTSGSTGAVAVLSSDNVVDNGDTLIGDQGVNPIAAGDSFTFDISGTPGFSTTGTREICVKVDATSNGNGLGGVIFETNETNNTFCTDVDVQFPVRDLTIAKDPNTMVPEISARGPIDPNAINAGNAVEVTFTVANIGTGVARTHVNAVVLSRDTVFDPNDQILCELPESFSLSDVPPGLLGGTSETRTFGLDPKNPCIIDFSQQPSDPNGGIDYFIGIVTDINNQVSEMDPNGVSLEGNNTAFIPIFILPPLPATLLAAQSAAAPGDTQQELPAPGKPTARFNIFSALDLASFSFTVAWSPASKLEIQDPSDVVLHPEVMATNGRVASCDPVSFDNTLGTITVTCTSTGANPGNSIASAKTLLEVHFHVLEPTTAPGTFIFDPNSVILTDSTGTMLTTSQAINGTFIVTGSPDLVYSNLVVPSEGFPGNSFTSAFDISNQGFAEAPTGTRSTVQISGSPSITAASPAVCSVLESMPIPGRTQVTRTVSTCGIIGDPRPGLYTVGVTNDPSSQSGSTTTPLQLPSRVFALRGNGSGRSIESTRAPDSGGSVGATLASDANFAPKSMGALRTTVRNFDLVAGYVKPAQGRLASLYRTPKFLNTDLDSQATTHLRLPTGSIAVLGGADIDGDGEDELVILKRDKTGQYLDFRRVNFAKRRPEIGSTVALTAPIQGRIVGATGIQFDGDPEDEIVLVVDDGTTQILSINDLAIQDPNSCIPNIHDPGCVPSTLVPLADDPGFGSASTGKVQGICVMDYGLDGTLLNPNEQIVALTLSSSGVQALRVFDPPTVLSPGAGAQALLVAEDPAFGGTKTRPRVLSIACTR